MLLRDYIAYLKKELGSLFEGNELQNHISILCQYYLKLDRAAVIVNGDKVLIENELSSLSNAVEQLKMNKPIDYIINETVFFWTRVLC